MGGGGEGEPPSKGGWLWKKKINKKVNNALPDLELVSIIYKNLTSDLTVESFILNYNVNYFPLLL